MKTKIYLVSNIDNNPKKVYIGKTINNRKNNHTRIYGKQISYDYIDEIDSLNHKDWKQIESKWIQHYIDLGYDVLNKNKGGGGVSFHTNETKQKMSKPKPEIIKIKIKNGLKGNKHINHKKGKEHGNYGKVRSEEHLKSMRKPKPEGFGLKMKVPKPNVSIIRSIPIVQYDIDNTIIKEWNNAVSASENLNLKVASICNALKGRAKTAGGFIWRYKIN
jgi:hypothetical protein